MRKWRPLFSGFALSANRPDLDVSLKVLILLAIMGVVNVSWLALGSALTRSFRRPVMSRAINIAFAVLLLASAAFAFLP